MKKYKDYQLSDIFNKIDTLLQKYFNKENDYEFYKKDEESYKTDLSKKSYVMFLCNGDKIKVQITKSSLPHLLGINTEYLKSTRIYGTKGSYEIMLEFIKNPQAVIKMHDDGIINLDNILSPYIEQKIDSLIDNLFIDVNCCEMVCSYDKEKTYCHSEEFDDMSYLILQKKNDKYYVLKLAKSNDNDNDYYPMSNQVFQTYEDLIENLSSYLFNQESTLLSAIKTYYNKVPGKSFYIQEWNRREKLEKLGALSISLECIPNVLNDYIYALKIRDDKRKNNIHDFNTMQRLIECIKNGIPLDLDGELVEEGLSKIISAYNDSLFKDISKNVGETYSTLIAENEDLKRSLKDASLKNDTLTSSLEKTKNELENAEIRYKDAEEKLENIKKIIN